jgi:hypothetical protein
MGVQVACKRLREDEDLVDEDSRRGYDQAVEVSTTPALERDEDGDEELYCVEPRLWKLAVSRTH